MFTGREERKSRELGKEKITTKKMDAQTLCRSSLNHLSFSPGSIKRTLASGLFQLSQSESANAAVWHGLCVIVQGFSTFCTFTMWASIVGEGRETLPWGLQCLHHPSLQPQSATATVEILKASTSVTRRSVNKHAKYA